MTLIDCDKLCIFDVISRATTEKAVQKDTFKTLYTNKNGI